MRTQYHRDIDGIYIRCTTTAYDGEYMEYSIFYHKNLKFLHKEAKKLVILKKKISIQNFAKIALIPKLLGF